MLIDDFFVEVKVEENMDVDSLDDVNSLDDVETDKEMKELFESLRKHKMRKSISRMHSSLSTHRENEAKGKLQKNTELKTENKNLQTIIEELKIKRLLCEEEEMQLNINDEMVQLMEQYKNTFEKKSTIKTIPYALKKFALTLNFYSPAAYKYVRSALKNCLPHPRTLCNWYSKTNGDPGFTSEAFNVLKVKSDNSKTKILSNLVIDEMSLYYDKTCQGYVDVGLNDKRTGQNLTSSALVLLLVCLNETWKIPIGYFYTHGLTSDKLANIINLALTKCADINVEVASVTCDDRQTNIAAMRVLGCKLNDPNNLETTFSHPTTGNDVALLLDPCHMLKLVRNTFASRKVFFTKKEEVNWKYVKRLQKIQDIIGNKINNHHIRFHNQILNFKLASQLLSNSVAQSLYQAKDLSPEFENCEPTAEFIKLHNDVFDVLNSNGDSANGFKKTLKPETKHEIFDLIQKYKDYIKNLQVQIILKNKFKRRVHTTKVIIKKKVQNVLDCESKTGFLGFLISLESLKVLYGRLVDTGLLKYIATYRLSQDHIELLFGCIRQNAGYNNSLNALQFKSGYKIILNHLELKSNFRVNCLPLEKINILSDCESGSKKDHIKEINKSSFVTMMTSKL